MFEGPGIAVSLPVRELAAAMPPASLFRIEDLAEEKLSSDLRTAIGLVVGACRNRNLPIVFVARPEIFTNAASLTWVQQKLDGIRDHLCITDGMSVKVIPQMRNHMFLYGLGIQANAESFARLRRRTPELLSTMGCQINTSYSVRLGTRRVQPPAVVIPAAGGRNRAASELFRFFVNKHSAQRSAERCLAGGAVDGAPHTAIAQTIYVPLTEAAARDAMFAEVVGGQILRAYFDPSIRVILRMPFLASPAASFAERIAAGLRGLCAARISIPRVTAENILISMDDLDQTALQSKGASVDLVAHESFDFWRHPPAFYLAAATVAVHVPVMRRRDRAGIRAVLGALLGRDPGLRWLPAPEHHDGQH